jgi:hypothetical protein
MQKQRCDRRNRKKTNERDRFSADSVSCYSDRLSTTPIGEDVMEAIRARRKNCAPTLRTWLRVTELERRDNPSVPAVLLDVPSMLVANAGPSYTETHQLTRSFSQTITVDQSGSGTYGTFTVDTIGQTHLTDGAIGSGGNVTDAEGTLVTDTSYHLVVHGHHTADGDVIDDEAYSESGTAGRTDEVRYDFINGDTQEFDGTYSKAWTTSWTAIVTNGQMSFSAFSYAQAESTTWHMRDDHSDGSYEDSSISTGWSLAEYGTGTVAVYAWTGTRESHSHSHTPGSEGGLGMPPSPPSNTYDDQTWSNSASGSTQLNTDPQSVDVGWNAEVTGAVGYTWHGVQTTSGALAETATYVDGRLDINSFETTSHFALFTHLVEDEPSVPDSGTGEEDYWKDDVYSFSKDTTGQGTYIYGDYEADFQDVRAASFTGHSILTVDGEEISGVDESGQPFELAWNYSSDRVTSGSATIIFNYHDDNDGTLVTSASYSRTDDSATSSQDWGSLDGDAFNEFSTSSEGAGSSLSLSGDGIHINSENLQDAFPFNSSLNPQFLAAYGGLMQQPLPPDIWFVQNVPNPIFFYNREVNRIGKLALNKVLATVLNEAVLLDMADQPGVGLKASGRFTLENGESLAQAAAKGRDLDKAAEQVVKLLKGFKYQDVKVVRKLATYTYGVEDAGTNPRSGRVAVSFRIDLVVSFKNTNGQPSEGTYSGTSGEAWFVDDKIKTADLVGPFPR